MAERVHRVLEESRPAEAGGPYGIIANVLWDRVLRIQAKVYLLGWHGDFENVSVWGLGKHGRRIQKYIPMKRLYHYRAAWLPPHVCGRGWLEFADKAHAQHTADELSHYWHGVRSFSSDGMTVLRDGISVGETLRRHRARS